MIKRKGSLLNRMLAVLLVAVLVVSMASNAAPVTVLAQEIPGTGMEEATEPESVSGNDAEPAEEETEPAKETDSEGQEPVESNMVTAAEIVETDEYSFDPGNGKLTIKKNNGCWLWAREVEKAAVISLEISDTVTEISITQAFANCSNLKSVSIADSVKVIRWQMFNGCSSLTDIKMDKVTTIESGAFDGCSSLTSIEIPSGVTELGEASFAGCSSLKSVKIPDGVTTIEANVFLNCSSLTSIKIPDKVTSIGFRAFSGCSSLTNIEIPAGVTNIGTSAFENCSNLTGIKLPSGVTNIGNSAFKNCSSLPSIEIPSGVTNIGTSAFENCSNLTEVRMLGKTPPTIDIRVFSSCPCVASGTKGIHVPAGTTEAGTTVLHEYKNAGRWSSYYKNNLTDGQTYTVTVNHGTGGGNCEEDAIVTIKADAPASGMQFDKWEVNGGSVTLANASSSTTTFTMPARAVTVTATYRESDAGKVEAAKAVVESALAGFTAKNDTTEADILGTINTALGNAGITDVTVKIDKFIIRKASASKAGSIEGVVFIDCGQESRNVNMEKPIAQLSAEKYTVTVSGGAGGGEYEAGATVTIKANAPASGKQFDKWVVNSGSVTLADSASSTTTFKMPAGAVSVTAVYKDITEEHTHNYGEWITDREATATEAGTKHRECQICGYRQTETIPATGTESGTGTVTPEVKPGANAPVTNISTPIEELKDMLLTDEEKEQVQNGTDIKVVLEVQDAGNTVSGSDKAAIAQALNGFTVGQYLNIDLYKLVGSERTDITETGKKIRIVITVPDSLKNADGSKTRTFAVIRVHNQSAKLLTDLDGSADTITIETDRFSTYAVVYKDTASSGSGNNNGNNSNQNSVDKNGTKPDSSKDNEPKTGDFTPLELYATLAMIAGFTYLLLYFADQERGMTEEMKKELVSRLVGWAKRGGRLRRYFALAAIFVLLVYYHSIGKKTCAEWKEIYGE